MKDALSTWLLAGALAASLAWNLRPARCAATPDTCANCTVNSGDCSTAIAALDLRPEQRLELARCGTDACRQSAQSDARANELARELFALLGQREVDPAAARTLADEVGRLRTKSLRDCVDSILEVRRILTPAQVGELLNNCCKAK
jgi:Spy/CpxP family protein refolding chaperone